MIDRPHVRKFRMKSFKNIKYSKKCAKQANYMKQVSFRASKLNSNANNCDDKILTNKKSNKTVDPQLNVLSNLSDRNDGKGRLRKVNTLAKNKLKNPLSAVPKNNLKSEENSSVYANSITYITRSSNTGKLSQMHQDGSSKAHMNKYSDINILKPQKCDKKIEDNLKIYKSQIPLDVLTICALSNGPKNKLRKTSIILTKCDIKNSLSTSLQDPHNFVKSSSTGGNSVKYATRSSIGKLSEIHQNISPQTEKIKKHAGIKLNKKLKKTVGPLNVLSNCTDRNDRKGRLRKINTLAKSTLKNSLNAAPENNFKSEENSSVNANSITYVTRSSTGKLSQMHQNGSSKAHITKYSDINMLKPKKCDNKIVDNVKKYKSQVPLDVLSIFALNNGAKNKFRKASVILSKCDIKNSLNTPLQDPHNFVKSSSTSGNSIKYETRSGIGKLSEIHQNILSQTEKIKKPAGIKLSKKEAVKRSNIPVTTANTEKSNYLKPKKPKVLVKKFRNRSTKVSEKRCLNSILNVPHSQHNRKGSSKRFFSTPLKCIAHNDKIEDSRISLQSKHDIHFHKDEKETIDPVHERKGLLVNNKHHPILKKSINCSSKQNSFEAEKLLNKTDVDNNKDISFINQSERRITRSSFNSTLTSEISLQKKTKITNSLKALNNSISPEIEYFNQHQARTNKYQTRLSLQMHPHSLTENQFNSFNHSLPKSIIRKSTRSKSMKESFTKMNNQKRSKTLKRKLKNTRQKFLEQTVLPAEHDSCKTIAQNSGATQYFSDSSNTPYIHNKSKPHHSSSSIVNIKSDNMLQSTPFCQSSQNIKSGLGKKRIFKLSNIQNLMPHSTPIAKKNKNVVDLQTPINSTMKLATKLQIVERKSTYRESKKAKNLLDDSCGMKTPFIKTPARGVSQYSKKKAEPRQRSRKHPKQKSLGMQNRKSSNIFNGEPKKSIPIDKLTLLANSTKKRRKQGSCPARIQASKSPNVKRESLKRKRSIIKALNEVNEGYEDDIFESHQFDGFKSAFQNFDDDSDVSSISTPKCFFLTPALPEKTPLFKDCITSDELCKARKVAEEYLYRRNKKRKIDSRELNETKVNPATSKAYDALHLPEKKRLEFFEAMNTIVNIQKTMEKQSQADSEDEQNSDDGTSDIFESY